MKDLKVKISLKNNLILQKIEEKFGRVNQAEASRLLSIRPDSLGGYLNFKRSPVTKFNSRGVEKIEEGLHWTYAAVAFAEKLDCCVWEIFPEHFWDKRRSQYEIDIESKKLISFEQSELVDWDDPEKEILKLEQKEIFKGAFPLLRPRQRLALYLRFVDEKSLLEIGNEMGISRERVRQIVLKAVRLMRIYCRRK